MAIKKVSLLIAGGMVLFFSLLYLFPFFNLVEDRLYDLFLRFKPEITRYDKIVFLDVDDQAIAHIGVFPWPRSVMAGGILRLKEYGAKNAIFDIEYIDQSPTQADEEYLKYGFKSDIQRHFSEISYNAVELIKAVASGQLKQEDIDDYITALKDIVGDEQESLYTEALGINRNNDTYLSQALALFKNGWGTLNLQAYPLEGEQAQRRKNAELYFSYPKINAAPGAQGGNSVDILGALPVIMESYQGAGFTNVKIDKDGIRRRVFLIQKVGDYWYPQLAFAPLLENMGSPEIELGPGKLVLKDAELLLEKGKKQDITIPLDRQGAMLLNWPKTTYKDSYVHLSFAEFSDLEEYQSWIRQCLLILEGVEPTLYPALVNEAAEISNILKYSDEYRHSALENNSEEDFTRYLELRDSAYKSVREMIDLGIEDYIQERSETFIAEFPDEYSYIEDERGYALTWLESLDSQLNYFLDNNSRLGKVLEGKFCILGRSDTGTTDIGVNPFYGEYVNVGTHAVVLDTIISGSFITPLGKLWSILLGLVLIPLIMFGIIRLKPGLRISLGALGVLFILGFSLSLFIFKGIFLGPLGPALALALGLVIQETIAFAGSEKEKQFYRKAFATYTSEAVADQIARNPQLLTLGGSSRHMTAIFTDVQGFSSISESLEKKYGAQGGAENLVKLLNNYLSSMSDVVLEQEGVIDKYEGDAIIAFFGAPQDLPDHALRACRSAVLMRRLEAGLNDDFLAQGLTPYPLRTRFGINTGSMVVGNMGTQRKMDYTIMGNAVNLAARLEGVNKQYGTWILASQYTVQETGGIFLTRRLDKVRVVGIDDPVQLCEILEINENASEELKEKSALFEEALTLFENREWTDALAGFRKVLHVSPDDEASHLFIDRCTKFQKSPPPDKWDGVFNLSQK